MENISKKYAEVQVLLLNLEKATNEYETHDQTPAHSQALVQAFSKTFQAFYDLISEYLAVHHKNFASGKSPQEIISNAHKAGFLAEHDSKTLAQAAKETEKPVVAEEENPLIHNLETYLETMQTILSEIKP
jgi:3-phosphoglycerate kinase